MAVTLTDKNEIRARIVTLNELAQLANNKLQQALANNDPKTAEQYRKTRDQYNREVQQLTASLAMAEISEHQGMAASTSSAIPTVNAAVTTTSRTSTTSSTAAAGQRELLKVTIQQLNGQALDADQRMRDALGRSDNAAAAYYRVKREEYNNEAKKLTAQLATLGTPATTSSATTTASTSTTGAGVATQPASSTTPASDSAGREHIKQQIQLLNTRARDADERLRQALSGGNQSAAAYYRKQRDDFNNQVKTLTASLNSSTGSGVSTTSTTSATGGAPTTAATTGTTNYSVMSREQLKQLLTSFNAKAQDADVRMRQALSNADQNSANYYRQLRDKYNMEVRQIQAALNSQPATPASPTATPEVTPSSSTAGGTAAGNASAQPTRALSAEEQKRLNVLKNEIARDQRILELHLASGNSAGVRKYEAIRKTQDAELNQLLFGSTGTGGAAQPAVTMTAEERELLEKLPYNIRFAEQRLAAGDSRYKPILAGLKADLARLQQKAALAGESTGAGTATTPSSGGGVSTTPAPTTSTGATTTTPSTGPVPGVSVPGLCNIQEIANNHYLNTTHPIPEDAAHNAIIRCLLSRNNYGFSAGYIQSVLKDINGQRFIIRSNEDISRIKSELPRNGDGRYVVGSFIRDAFKLNLETSSTDPVYFSDFDISDDISESAFVSHFNGVVNDVNNYLRTLGSNKKTIGSFDAVGHRDAVQIVPVQRADLGGRDNYLGARIMRPVIISNNVISSPQNRLQGIFASDGAFQDMQVLHNKIKINGAHTISFNGVLSGKFIGNTDLDGNPLGFPQIKLLPLRLGGGSNIYVTGFHPSSSYQYSTSSIPADIDYRRQPSTYTRRGRATFFRNFYMERFFEEFRQIINSSTDLALATQRRKADEIQRSMNPRHYVGMDLYYQIHLAIERMISKGYAQVDER